ncbi:DUF4031 domain-containing protein [Leucobacter coleopterorum]|uniref:DUF4031 domain-containing protein n=1 Tax=Leucobacter coleopterorum TaxID=2714933 RepID=A0ABX6JZR3_9MICO|nr:DUF4031 domain-containing protein [Leucobacter coleopterorum]QIM18260.1 DUF4031 domain-containing protein [Leucobacter coleopterorum]
MAILIDPPAWPAHGTLWSHLVSDTSYDELHAFAARLNVPRRGFDLDHYDVPASLYEQAIALGARPISGREIVHRLQDAGLRVRQVDRQSVAPVRRRQYLVGEWAELGERLGVADPGHSGSEWHSLGSQLVDRWNEPHRSYHDERHLEDVLLALNQLAARGESISDTTLLAAWFHDAVYAGTESDELDSARLAVEKLGIFLFTPEAVNQVSSFVAATAPAHVVRDPATPLAHLLDADLSIFAARPTRYEEYAQSVRLEYAHIATTDFALGRARILTGYLERPAIYHTEPARQLWERRARQNLELEVERLRRDALAGD